MSLVTPKISLLRWASLNDDVSPSRRIFSVRVDLMQLPRQIRWVYHTKGHHYNGHFVITDHQKKRKKKSADDYQNQNKNKVNNMDVIENELSKIVGMDSLKLQLRKWLKGMILDARRRDMGLQVGPRRLPQFAFLGNPGTGKTMVARKLSRLLHTVGILPKDKVTEVQRTDLIGQYIGQTGVRTREKIREAEGGILFVDEAYRLVPEGRSSNDYGLEALEEIMSFMDNQKLVVIFAGYEEPMNCLISSNEGIRRRISNVFHFDDFSCELLAQILHLKLPNKDTNSPFYGFRLDPRGTSVKDIATLIQGGTSAEMRGKMNGGLVDQMLVKARENLDSRIDAECKDIYAMVAITLEDLAAGLRMFTGDEKEEKKQEEGQSFHQKVLECDIKIKELEREVVEALKAYGLDPMVLDCIQRFNPTHFHQ